MRKVCPRAECLLPGPLRGEDIALAEAGYCPGLNHRSLLTAYSHRNAPMKMPMP